METTNIGQKRRGVDKDGKNDDTGFRGRINIENLLTRNKRI